MPKTTKPFRFATEGATCDGRTIARQDILDMAATYNRQTYSARVNMEHIRGFSADPPFCAYGDVVSLSTAEVELDVGGKKEKRLALVGIVEATDDLVKLNARGQKLFPSIELNPNFAASGKAYLQGLAITDSPASLGTEILTFAASKGDANPFASKKVVAGNLFSAADEAGAVALEFEDATPVDTAGIIAAIKTGFATFAATFSKDAPKDEPKKEEPKTPANDNDLVSFATAMGDQVAKAIGDAIGPLRTDFAALKTELATVKSSIDTTDNHSQRRGPATGPKGSTIATDC